MPTNQFLIDRMQITLGLVEVIEKNIRQYEGCIGEFMLVIITNPTVQPD